MRFVKVNAEELREVVESAEDAGRDVVFEVFDENEIGLGQHPSLRISDGGTIDPQSPSTIHVIFE